jgi:hypothetical protein
LPPQLVPARHAMNRSVQAALKERDVHSAAGCGKRVAGLAQARRERGRLGGGGGVRAVCSSLRDADDLAGKRRECIGGPPATIVQSTACTA